MVHDAIIKPLILMEKYYHCNILLKCQNKYDLGNPEATELSVSNAICSVFIGYTKRNANRIYQKRLDIHD